MTGAPGPVTVSPDGKDVRTVLDGDGQADLPFSSTAAPYQGARLTRDDAEHLRGVLEGPEQGWPSSVLVIEIDRGVAGDALADRS